MTPLADGLGLNAVDQLFDDFEVDVGFEQGQPDFAQASAMFSSLSRAWPRRDLKARCSFS
jgi:hypothetical protein